MLASFLNLFYCDIFSVCTFWILYGWYYYYYYYHHHHNHHHHHHRHHHHYQQLQPAVNTRRITCFNLRKMSLKICASFDVFTNSVAEGSVDNVPLVRHLCGRLAQHLVDQVAILLRLCSYFLRPCDDVTAMLSPALLIRDTADNTQTPVYICTFCP